MSAYNTLFQSPEKIIKFTTLILLISKNDEKRIRFTKELFFTYPGNISHAYSFSSKKICI